jgi:hypothetical protein
MTTPSARGAIGATRTCTTDGIASAAAIIASWRVARSRVMAPP